jgi:hypothetical protein
MLPEDPVLRMSEKELDALIESFPGLGRPISRHLELTLALVQHRRWKAGEHRIQHGPRPGDTPALVTLRPSDPPVLKPGDPVPGCNCQECSGLSAEQRDRVAATRTRRQWRGRGGAAGRERAPLDIEAARQASIVDVARRLGLGEPRKVGREYLVRCPLHEDSRPSMRLNVGKGLWICDPCGLGGDVINLVQRVRACDFRAAVLELTGGG